MIGHLRLYQGDAVRLAGIDQRLGHSSKKMLDFCFHGNDKPTIASVIPTQANIQGDLRTKFTIELPKFRPMYHVYEAYSPPQESSKFFKLRKIFFRSPERRLDRKKDYSKLQRDDVLGNMVVPANSVLTHPAFIPHTPPTAPAEPLQGTGSDADKQDIRSITPLVPAGGDNGSCS